MGAHPVIRQRGCILMSYGIKIKQIRLSVGMSLEDAASRSGISAGTLYSYENEELPLPVTAFVKLAKTYGFDVLEVLGVNEPENEAQIRSLVYDAPPVELLKAYCDIVVKKEQERDLVFGNRLPSGYYEKRYSELFGRVKDYPAIKVYFPDIESE